MILGRKGAGESYLLTKVVIIKVIYDENEAKLSLSFTVGQTRAINKNLHLVMSAVAAKGAKGASV